MADDDAERPGDPWTGVLAARIAAVHQQRAALLAAIDQTREALSLMFADDEHDPDGSTASLKTADGLTLTATPVALLAGVVEETVGGVVSGAAPVLNDQE